MLQIPVTCLAEVLDDGSVKCWGCSRCYSYTQPVLGWPRPSVAGMGDNLPAIDLGSTHNNAVVGVRSSCAAAVCCHSCFAHSQN